MAVSQCKDCCLLRALDDNTNISSHTQFLRDFQVCTLLDLTTTMREKTRCGLPSDDACPLSRSPLIILYPYQRLISPDALETLLSYVYVSRELQAASCLENGSISMYLHAINACML